jgi:hypothetical protein
LPFIEANAAYDTANYSASLPVYAIVARRAGEAVPVSTTDPNLPNWTYGNANLNPWTRTDYAANDHVVVPGWNVDGCQCYGKVQNAAGIRDGLSNTMLAGEKAAVPQLIAGGDWAWDEPIILGGAGGTARCSSLLISDGQLARIFDQQGGQAAIDFLVGPTDFWSVGNGHLLPFPEPGPFNRYPPCLGGGWGSPDPSGVQFLMCDGSVRSISYNVSTSVMAAITTPDQRDRAAIDF